MKELAKDLRFDYFNVKTVPARLKRLAEDPWKGFAAVRQTVTASMFEKVGSIKRTAAREPQKTRGKRRGHEVHL